MPAAPKAPRTKARPAPRKAPPATPTPTPELATAAAPDAVPPLLIDVGEKTPAKAYASDSWCLCGIILKVPPAAWDTSARGTSTCTVAAIREHASAPVLILSTDGYHYPISAQLALSSSPASFRARLKRSIAFRSPLRPTPPPSHHHHLRPRAPTSPPPPTPPSQRQYHKEAPAMRLRASPTIATEHGGATGTRPGQKRKVAKADLSRERKSSKAKA